MRNQKSPVLFLASIILVSTVCYPSVAIQAQSQTEAGTPYFTQPAISPDLKEIAFVSGGDIWTVPSSGGVARLLVSSPYTEARPLYSPDGGKLAFISNRTGGGDIYILDLKTGEQRRLTFDAGYDQLDAWSYDGRWIYFSTTSHDLEYFNDVYRVSSEGGTPMPVCGERYTNEYFSAPSPDGTAVAFTAHGIDSTQWWRKGHSHLDESEIWLRRDGNPASYEKVSGGDWKDIWPMWSAGGKGVYYVSDQSGAQNIWYTPLAGKAAQVTRFNEGRVLWPSISYDGREMVFEHDFKIWKLDPSGGRPSEVLINLLGAASGPLTTHLTLTNGISELALSPDGKKLAFIVHGEVFAASAADGGEALRVTRTEAEESDVIWAPDSRHLVYSSDRDGARNLFSYDFGDNSETRLTTSSEDEYYPTYSPDGKTLAFIRGDSQLILLDAAAKKETVVAKAPFRRPPFGPAHALTFSPDGKWLAFEGVSGRMFSNLFVVPTSGGEVRQISFIPNGFSDSLSWSPDGKFVLFDTGQRTERRNVARVDLVRRTPKFRENEFRDLFKESPKTIPPTEKTDKQPAPASDKIAEKASGDKKDENKDETKKPVEIVFDGIDQRASFLATGLDVNHETISPDGKTLLMTAAAAGRQNLYVFPLDELAKEPPIARQLTATPGFKNYAQFSQDGKTIYYLENGRIQQVSVDGRENKPISVTAEMDVNFSKEKIEVFNEVWGYLNDNFFDANFNGVDWPAMKTKYRPLIEGARTPDEMRDLLELMIGELNASHCGMGGPSGGEASMTGRLGLIFDPAEYENAGHLKITDVTPLGPADLAGSIKTGDYLLSVDGAAIGAHTNLDQLLDHKIGKRVVLSVASSADGSGKREVEVRPVPGFVESGLFYRQWVEKNREYVSKISGGRLGYIHMQDMGSDSLESMFMDLDEKNLSRDGVVIDIRNNSGGFVNAYAIDVLSRIPYLTMSIRGIPSAPARGVLGQRSLERPTILVINRESLSDAEDFTEGYRTLKLGKVVGEPTAGWIIYTGGVGLVDGSFLRLPFIKVTGHDGGPMEMHPRPVDIPVSRPVGESFSDKDSDLDTAVKELLKQLGTEKDARSGK